MEVQLSQMSKADSFSMFEVGDTAIIPDVWHRSILELIMDHHFETFCMTNEETEAY